MKGDKIEEKWKEIKDRIKVMLKEVEKKRGSKRGDRKWWWDEELD